MTLIRHDIVKRKRENKRYTLDSYWNANNFHKCDFAWNRQSIMHGNMKQTIQATVNDAKKPCIFCAQIASYWKLHLTQIKRHMVFWTDSGTWLFVYVEKQWNWRYVKFHILVFRV